MTAITGDRLAEYELAPERFSLERWYRNIRRIERMELETAKRNEDYIKMGKLVAKKFTAEERRSFEHVLALRKVRHEHWRAKAARALEQLGKDAPERMVAALEVRYG